MIVYVVALLWVDSNCNSMANRLSCFLVLIANSASRLLCLCLCVTLRDSLDLKEREYAAQAEQIVEIALQNAFEQVEEM